MQHACGTTSSALGANADPFSASLLASAMESLGSAVVVTNINGYIVWANETFLRLSGYVAEEILGATPAIFQQCVLERTSLQTTRDTTGRRREPWRAEVTNKRKDGSVYITGETVTALRNEYGVVSHYIIVQHDITELVRDQQQAHRRANYDMLTGLACRAHLLSLHQSALTAAQCARRTMATLFIDLDGFKEINDRHGHQRGDDILRAVAARLLGAVRHSDVVSRFGGDEFVILLPEVSNRRVAIRLARKIVSLLDKPFSVGAERHALSASIGIAFYPDHGLTSEALMVKADQAMYAVKRMGGNGYRMLGTPSPGAGQRAAGFQERPPGVAQGRVAADDCGN